MAISEQDRHELHTRLADILGTGPAAILMSHLPPVGWADVATKQDLGSAVRELRLEMGALRSDLRAEITKQGSDLRLEITKQGSDLRAEISKMGGDLRGEISKQGRIFTIALVAALGAQASAFFALIQTGAI